MPDAKRVLRTEIDRTPITPTFWVNDGHQFRVVCEELARNVGDPTRTAYYYAEQIKSGSFKVCGIPVRLNG
jgi:hypothetical protein